MATLTTKIDRTFTKKEALVFIRDVKGRCRFSIRLGWQLPVGDKDASTYYPGSGLLQVSRKQALEAIKSGFSEVFEGKGARLRITADPAGTAYENSPAFIWIG